MKRRKIMHLLAGAAALAAASPLMAEGRKQAVWKTAIGLNGFGSSSWKYKKTYPIWEVLDYAARTGFAGIELMMNWPMGGYPLPDETARVAALKRLYDAYGLHVFSLQMGAGGAFAPDADARKTFLEDFRNCAKLIKALGGDCVGMWPGGPLKDQTHQEAVRHVAGSFREAARIGRDLGLVLLVVSPMTYFSCGYATAFSDRAWYGARLASRLFRSERVNFHSKGLAIVS